MQNARIFRETRDNMNVVQPDALPESSGLIIGVGCIGTEGQRVDKGFTG